MFSPGCYLEILTRNIRDKRSPREACFELGGVKVEKDIVTFENDIVTVCEKEDEDTFVAEGLQIERGTVFHKDTCHCEIYPRNIVTKRLPREACFDQGDCQVEKDVATLSGDEDEDTFVEEGP